MGCILLQINKDDTRVRLRFLDVKSDRYFNLTFEGLLFETSYLILNKPVIHTELTNVLGFKAASN